MTHIIATAAFAFMEPLSSAVRTISLAAVAGLGLTLLRVTNTSLRLFVWTVVLYAGLAMPFLGGMLPPVSIAAPGFVASEQPPSLTDISSDTQQATELISHPSQSAPTERTSRTQAAAGVQPSGARPASTRHTSVPSAQESSSGPLLLLWISTHWSAIAYAVYSLVAAILVTRFGLGIVLSHRLIRSSQYISDPRLTVRVKSSFDALAGTLRVAESNLISVPMTVGILRPAILLPSCWREWNEAKFHAVIAHELSHVLRHDALTQRMSRLHRAIFWFSPLAWWLDRHLADLAEQASDEAALSLGVDRNDYARTLLSFFEALHRTQRRVRWEGVAMAKPGQAEQRLQRILAWKGTVTMGLKKSLTIAVVALGIPVIYLAAAVRPANMNQEPASPAPAVASTPQVAPAPPGVRISGVPAMAPVAGVSGFGPIGGAPALAPAPPAIPALPAALAERHGMSRRHGFSYAFGFDDDERFVVVSGKSDSYTMSGSTQDIRHVEKLKKQIPGAFIWFQRDEKSYIIRDQATVDKAQSLWAPQEELGKRQEELGKQQEALGKQQEELGNQMEQVRVNVPDMTAALDKLKAKLQKLGPTATVEQLGDLQSEIGELQSKMGEIQSGAGDQQGKLGKLQGELGEKQGKLGEQQGELGRQQGELAEKASHQMKELLDEAIKNGTAKPESELDKSSNP